MDDEQETYKLWKIRVSISVYREAVRSSTNISYVCEKCTPVGESTRLASSINNGELGNFSMDFTTSPPPSATTSSSGDGHTKGMFVRVYRAILRMLPTAPAVRSVVLDFERATWVATRKVLPTVSIRGCAFHWGQAVWRKCQKLGLQVIVYFLSQFR
ncbi:unnamed protein product [Mytilus edulis]|uniref:MULE transposase domain-containing protein n=1 Tax=Mytilus edulis TaxID=6550 RepID=A0A8S3QC11_MYTED|nr:unnamed protein product [Mytilus edulis]